MFKFNNLLKISKSFNINAMLTKYSFKNFYYNETAARHGAGEVKIILYSHTSLLKESLRQSVKN